MHNLPPKVTSTPEVEAAVDALAKHRQAEAQTQEAEDARQRARALMRGESVPLGDSSVEPQPPPKAPLREPDRPPAILKTPVSRPGAGDKSALVHPACVRARALDGKGSDSAGARPKGCALRGPDFFRQAYAGLFGHDMQPEPG